MYRKKPEFKRHRDERILPSEIELNFWAKKLLCHGHESELFAGISHLIFGAKMNSVFWLGFRLGFKKEIQNSSRTILIVIGSFPVDSKMYLK